MDTILELANGDTALDMPEIPERRFEPGVLYVTAGVHVEMAVRYDEDQVEETFMAWLLRHLTGKSDPGAARDQGTVSAAINQRGVMDGVPVLTQYRFAALRSEEDRGIAPPPVWVLTNAARTRTAILLPGEYCEEFK